MSEQVIGLGEPVGAQRAALNAPASLDRLRIFLARLAVAATAVLLWEAAATWLVDPFLDRPTERDRHPPVAASPSRVTCSGTARRR